MLGHGPNAPLASSATDRPKPAEATWGRRIARKARDTKSVRRSTVRVVAIEISMVRSSQIGMEG